MTALVFALLAQVQVHVDAAGAAAAQYRLEPELLLAIAYHESRFRPDVVAHAGGRSFCGVMQVRADNAEHCRELADLDVGYLAGARVLRAWITATHGDLEKALAGYGCGWWGVEHGCRDFAPFVIALRNRYRKAASS
jgi:soluble lytic murein transglycosylase-like protein